MRFVELGAIVALLVAVVSSALYMGRIEGRVSSLERVFEVVNDKKEEVKSILSDERDAILSQLRSEAKKQKEQLKLIDIKRVRNCKESEITSSWVSHQVPCPDGYLIIGGGCDMNDWIEQVGANGPTADFKVWRCTGRGTINHKVNICPNAICMKSS
ncbi:hypothetical protein R7Z48_11950 [Vibrio sp. 1567]|uniref:hypothetical protein n=1 Tax=Vibrio sp. 1567 TaxID=3074564 RepID=UPI0029649CBF|nr:hypothetical protein [Vibrio sp. 1567]MDW2170141.1 hypothetical protein [Vibrio sp. 1567]